MKRDQKIIALFETIRDIPYGYIGSRNPLHVLKAGKGTCSGKHLLLGYLYQAIGIEVQYMMCLTKFNFLKHLFPDELRILLEEKDIYDYHNFLRIYINRWVDIDITFDLPLKAYGFSVNHDWDCMSDCEIALPPIEVCQVAELIKEKEQALNTFSEDQQRARNIFIKKMSEWMGEIRQKKLPECKEDSK